MNDTQIQKIREILLDRLRERGFCQVNGYNRFELVRKTSTSVVFLREKGTLASIEIADIEKAIQAYFKNSEVYQSPSHLRKIAKINYTTSPIWSILRLADEHEINSWATDPTNRKQMKNSKRSKNIKIGGKEPKRSSSNNLKIPSKQPHTTLAQSLSWYFLQDWALPILHQGLQCLQKSSFIEWQETPNIGHGVYLFSDKEGMKIKSLYSGESLVMMDRLIQHMSLSKNSFCMKVRDLLKKESIQVSREQAWQLCKENVVYQVLEVNFGRKELEEFAISNLKLPLNKKHSNVSVVLANSNAQKEYFNFMQENALSILQEGYKIIMSNNSLTWRATNPQPSPGVYVLSDKNETIIYVGESANLNKRFKQHSKTTRSSALRRSVGRKHFSFEYDKINKCFEPNEEDKISSYIEGLKVRNIPVKIGRLELEEFLIHSESPKLNTKHNS